MKSIAVLLAGGFEEAEAVIVVDFFRRLEQKVETLACGQTELEVMSYHDVPVRADALLSRREDRLYDAVMLPGGPGGARRLGGDTAVIAFVRKHLEAGVLVCPFCSAGAHVMAANGLLDGREYTCSGDSHSLYGDGLYVDKRVVRSGNILTGKGLGAAFEYVAAMARALGLGDAAARQLEHIYVE